jgi:Ca-activated chloride channel family protein
MRFGSPASLTLLLLVPVMAALLWVSIIARGRRLRRFVSATLLPGRLAGASMGRLVALSSIRIAAVGLVALALARPQWGRKDEPVVRRGIDVVLALDLSASMLAEDVSPDRLEQARAEATSLLRALTGDRVALIAFGGRATLQCPLTLDYGAVRLFLDAADASFSPGPGTDLGRAMELAARVLGSSGSSERRYKAVVLLTDGEDLEGGAAEGIQKAREAGIVVHAIGVGTARGGPIPLRDDGGALTGYKKDRDGKVVTTRLDSVTLEKIALATEGVFAHAGPAGDAGSRIAEAISGMEKREIGSRLATRFEDRFQIPLALAFLLLVIEVAWIPRRRGNRAGGRGAGAARGSTNPAPVVRGAAAAALAAIALMLLATGSARADAPGSDSRSSAASPAPGSGQPSTEGASPPARSAQDARPIDAGPAPTAAIAKKTREGNRIYKGGDYPGALSKYEDAGAGAPDLAALRYNIGNALLRQGKYPEAASEYHRALQNAGPSLAPAVRYNLGNAQFLQKQYKEAAESYRKVLEKRPSDEEARRNLELALRALQVQQQQQQQQQSDSKDKQDKDGKDQKQRSGGTGEDRKQQQQQQQEQQEQQQRQQQQQNESGGQDQKNGQSASSPAGKDEQGKIGKKEAERLLDSIADEEKRDLKRRLARMPRENGPEKDW